MDAYSVASYMPHTNLDLSFNRFQGPFGSLVTSYGTSMTISEGHTTSSGVRGGTYLGRRMISSFGPGTGSAVGGSSKGYGGNRFQGLKGLCVFGIIIILVWFCLVAMWMGLTLESTSFISMADHYMPHLNQKKKKSRRGLLFGNDSDSSSDDDDDDKPGGPRGYGGMNSTDDYYNSNYNSSNYNNSTYNIGLPRTKSRWPYGY